MPQHIGEIEGAAGKTARKSHLPMHGNSEWSLSGLTTEPRFNLTLRPRIEIKPELLDWKTGDGEVLQGVCGHSRTRTMISVSKVCDGQTNAETKATEIDFGHVQRRYQGQSARGRQHLERVGMSLHLPGI
jgi:hypothetical protein